ncbi:hypothetical protein DVH24_018813 [Malus domestica]|uniref:Uncharacterized protein n=1 Tax=Malus domestica TaxID=3750 RepID=A0A498HIY9_MALDO|nr:hypothetical protein DVH24_018813 [Malus domestica]
MSHKTASSPKFAFIFMHVHHKAFWELIGFGFHQNSKVKQVRVRDISGWHEAFWELTGFEFHRNSEVKRVRARAIS